MNAAVCDQCAYPPEYQCGECASVLRGDAPVRDEVKPPIAKVGVRRPWIGSGEDMPPQVVCNSEFC